DKKALDVHFLTSSQNQNTPSSLQARNVFRINILRRFSCRCVDPCVSCRRAIVSAIRPEGARPGARLQLWNRPVRTPTHTPSGLACPLDSMSRKCGKQGEPPTRAVQNVLPPARGSWCFCNSSFG